MLILWYKDGFTTDFKGELYTKFRKAGSNFWLNLKLSKSINV